MLNIGTKRLEGGLETRHFRTTKVEILGICKQCEDKTVNIFFKNICPTVFQLLSKETKINVLGRWGRTASF